MNQHNELMEPEQMNLGPPETRQKSKLKEIWESSIEKATATTVYTAISITVVSVITILYAIFVVYLGVFAHGNPDPPHCYFIDGLTTTGLTKAAVSTLATERGIPIRAGYPLDIAHLFRAWFIWGFWTSLIQISIVAVFVPVFRYVETNIDIYKMVALVMQGMMCCSTMIWFLVGFFWRYSKGGRVASGDKLEKVDGVTDEEWNNAKKQSAITDGYQFNSGRFMSTYLILILTILLIAVGTGAVFAVVHFCWQSDQNSKQ